MTEHESSFDAMGCGIRLIIGSPVGPGARDSEAAAIDSRRWIESFDRRMSRFRHDSELSRMNRDPRSAVAASALLRATVSAGLWAARQTNGLVDPTLMSEIESAGYASSLAGAVPASLTEALAVAPARHPAAPSLDANWRLVTVDEDAGLIHRPPGVRIDSGGAGKGLAADALARRLSRYSRVAIDCGGDVRVSGPASRTQPFEVVVDHPLMHEPAHRFWLGDGAVATSGLATRIWRKPDGEFAHHLLDPRTGRPAWTGVIQATAIAHSALEAETLSKQALLSGPARARELLAPFGGALVRDDGVVELIGSLSVEELVA